MPFEKKTTPQCPLCYCKSTDKFHRDKRRDYFKCPECDLIFVPKTQLLSPEKEKERYDLHENSSNDEGYRNFLNRMYEAIRPHLNKENKGLDFGCGPAPILASIFEKAGYSMKKYDHFYAKDISVFEHQYDFITTTEVVEHLHHPLAEIEKLWNIIKPGGQLGIMTNLFHNEIDFGKWYYKNDATHVCFFSKLTFKWLAKRWNAEIEFTDKDILVMHKKA